MNIIFAPGETIILSSKGEIEQPVQASGEAYLTNKRLLLIQKSGLIFKKETPILDIRLTEISYAKIEGLIFKSLVIGVPRAGTVVTYKVKVSNPEAWLAKIHELLSSQKQ